MATNKKDVSEMDTKNTVAAAEKTTAPNEKERYAGVTKFVYVGPSLPGGRLKSNTVVCGKYAEITEYYKEAIALYPSAEKLIVPVTRLADAREKTQNSGNAMYNHYQEIAAAIKAKGDEQ